MLQKRNMDGKLNFVENAIIKGEREDKEPLINILGIHKVWLSTSILWVLLSLNWRWLFMNDITWIPVDLNLT